MYHINLISNYDRTAWGVSVYHNLQTQDTAIIYSKQDAENMMLEIEAKIQEKIRTNKID